MASLPLVEALSETPLSNVPVIEPVVPLNVPVIEPMAPLLKVKGLPPGWRREVVVRKNGQSAGKTDVYYYSPCGKKFRSKPQIARFLGDCADLSAFDFSRAGTPGDGTQRRRARDRSTKKNLEMLRSAPLIRPLSNNPLRPSGPVRRTCGVIKLPVVYVRDPSPSEEDGQECIANVPESSAKEGGVPETSKLNPISPIPITTSSGVVVPTLWENRLLGVKACDYETGDDIVLPAKSQNGTNSSSESTVKLLTTSAGTNQSRVSGKLPLSSPVGGILSASLLAQQLQASLKQAVGLGGGTSVIPSLLQRTTTLKNGQFKDNNTLMALHKSRTMTTSTLGGAKMIEKISRMVTDNDLRLQEEKVRHLRQQLMAAEQN